jgi:hypothetical protein
MRIPNYSLRRNEQFRGKSKSLLMRTYVKAVAFASSSVRQKSLKKGQSQHGEVIPHVSKRVAQPNACWFGVSRAWLVVYVRNGAPMPL